MSKLLLRFLVYSVCACFPSIAVAGSVSEVLTIFVKGSSPSLTPARAEVARLMAPAGFQVEWKDISERRPGLDFARLVIVELRGNCAAPVNLAVPSSVDTRSLASTAIVDGKVLPFSTVQCDSLRKLMSRTQAGPGLFGRAMGRVIAHEIYHMLAETRNHASEGVSKSCFSVNDLLAEDFSFDSATLAYLRPPEPDLAPAAAYDFPSISEASGR